MAAERSGKQNEKRIYWKAHSLAVSDHQNLRAKGMAFKRQGETRLSVSVDFNPSH